jgi:hypothetical protein
VMPAYWKLLEVLCHAVVYPSCLTSPIVTLCDEVEVAEADKDEDTVGVCNDNSEPRMNDRILVSESRRISNVTLGEDIVPTTSIFGASVHCSWNGQR